MSVFLSANLIAYITSPIRSHPHRRATHRAHMNRDKTTLRAEFGAIYNATMFINVIAFEMVVFSLLNGQVTMTAMFMAKCCTPHKMSLATSEKATALYSCATLQHCLRRGATPEKTKEKIQLAACNGEHELNGSKTTEIRTTTSPLWCKWRLRHSVIM